MRSITNMPWLLALMLALVACSLAYSDKTSSIMTLQGGLDDSLFQKGSAAPSEQEAREDQEYPLKVVVSGFYHLEREEFVVPAIKILRTRRVTSSFSEKEKAAPIVIFQLTDANEILQTIRQPYENQEVEIFYDDGTPERRPTGLCLMSVTFDLPESRKDLWVHVVSHKGNVIYSVSLEEPLAKLREI